MLIFVNLKLPVWDCDLGLLRGNFLEIYSFQNYQLNQLIFRTSDLELLNLSYED